MNYKVLTNSKIIKLGSFEKILILMVICIFYIPIRSLFPDVEILIFFDVTLGGVGILCMLLLVVISFYRGSQPEPINRELNGNLEFKADAIILDNKTYQLTEIKKIKLTAYDYVGQATRKRSFGSYGLSNGTNNELAITLFNNQTLKVNFQQSYKHQIYNNERENLINYCNEGVMNKLNLLDILEISGYNNVQDFKKKYLTQSQ